MRKATSLTLLVLALTVAAGSGATAEAAGRRRLAATNRLPAALRALAAASDEILGVEEAGQVRGQWLLSLDLPLVAARIQGQGQFDVNLLTVSSGVLAGTPVIVHITVGSRVPVIHASGPPF